MGPVMTQFGLPPEVAAAANSGDMQAFFKALEDTSPSDASNSQDDKKEEKPKEGNDKKDDDADMALD